MSRAWFKSKQLTRQTLTGTTTPASVLSLSFGYDASTDYYAIWSLQGDYSVTSRNGAWALNDTTGAASFATPSVRPNNTANVFSVGGIAKWSSPGSSGTRQFDITHAPGNSADTIGSDEIFLMVMKKDSTDQYAENLTADSRTSSTLADRATLTFTPGSQGDYLILFSAEVGGIITATTNGSCRSLLDIDGTEYFDTVDGYFASTASARPTWAGALVVNLTAASHTIKIRYSSPDNTSTANIRNTRILAIRLDTFGQSATDQDATEQSTSSTSYQSAATAALTAVATEYMNLGTGLFRYSTSARAGQVEVDMAGTTRSVLSAVQLGGGTRYSSYIGFGYDTLVAGSRTLDVKWKASNGSDTSYIKNAFAGMFHVPGYWDVTSALQAQAAVIASDLEVGHNLTAALQAQSATMAGALVLTHTLTAALQAQSAAIEASLEVSTGVEVTIEGELNAQAATLSGILTVGGALDTIREFYLLGGRYNIRVAHSDPGLVILLQQQVPGGAWIDVSIPIIGDYDTSVALPPGTYRFIANVVGTPAISVAQLYRRGPL